MTSLAKLRLSPYYLKLNKLQASEESGTILAGVADSDYKVVRQICGHLDLTCEKKDGKLLIKKPGHDFFDALDMTALSADDKAGLSGYVARGDLVGADKLAKMSTVSQSNLFTALLAFPQGAEPAQGCRLLETMSGTATWPSEEAKKFFDLRARQATTLFLAEGKECKANIENKDTEALVRTGRCQVDVMLTDGRVKGEIQVSNSNHYEGGRRGDMKVEEESFLQQGRGLLVGDCASIRPMDGGHTTECEVVVVAPLILRPLAEPPPGTTGSGKAFRVDGLANRQQLARTLTAIHLMAAPPSTQGNNIRDRKKMFGLMGFNRPSEDVLAVLFSTSNQAPKVKGSKRCKGREIVTGLNKSQRQAMKEASARCFTLVQGPPGTGKTTVACRILKAWALSRAQSKKKNIGGILCSSDSNIAVDNIVEGLVKQGVYVVRIGRPESARPEVLEHCVDEIAARDCGMAEEPSKFAGDDSKKRFGVNRAKLDQAGREKLKAAVQNVLSQADVVCCTAIGAGSVVLNQLNFSRVLVDEAAQATELATLVPICRGALQVVLCGDQCQLPPTIGVDSVRDEGLEISLFERLATALHKPHVLLDAQHRMHPAISAFPRAAFYGGRLMDGIEAEDRRPLKGFSWPNRKMPLCFLPARGSERREGESHYNEREAAMVVDIVKDLVHGGLDMTDIGVVTPYAAQVRLVRRLLAKSGMPSSRERGGVETNSVDGYQGREKEAIIISTVRSSSSGGIGFVADWRRANVAFTRARRGLVVVGDPATLGREAMTWGPWLKWVKKTGCYSPSGSLDNLPTARTEADGPKYVGLPPEPGMSTEELLRNSADAWRKGGAATEFQRKRSRSRSQSSWDAGSDVAESHSASCSRSRSRKRSSRDDGKRRKVTEEKDDRDKRRDRKEVPEEKGSKDKKQEKEKKATKLDMSGWTKKEKKKEKKRLKKEKKKDKKAKKKDKKKSSSTSSDISSSLSLSSG